MPQRELDNMRAFMRHRSPAARTRPPRRQPPPDALRSPISNRFSKAEWIAYYSKKRIEQQWMQLHLLSLTRSERVLEVGPGPGLVTALLVNVGYQVVTLDQAPRAFAYPDIRHLEKDTMRSSAARRSNTSLGRRSTRCFRHFAAAEPNT